MTMQQDSFIAWLGSQFFITQKGFVLGVWWQIRKMRHQDFTDAGDFEPDFLLRIGKNQFWANEITTRLKII